MSNEKKIEMLADILDLETEELSPETKLSSLAEWDSIAILSFIAMMDEEFGKAIKGADIKQFETIQDAMNVMGE